MMYKMKHKIFLDSAFAIALASETDVFHQKAVRISEHLDAANLVTTLLQSLETDESVVIVPLSDELYEKGLSLYTKRPDKAWGMTDCISFIVMQEHDIAEALTTDAHFQQAGIRALLREES